MATKKKESLLDSIMKVSLHEAKDKDDDQKMDKKNDSDDEDDDKSDDDDVKSKKSDKDDSDDSKDNDSGSDDGDDSDDKSDKKPPFMKFAKEEAEEIDEETTAAGTLKPAAKAISDPKSKIGMMTSVMSQMHQMNKGDLTDWFTKTMSQFGPGKDYGVGDKSGSNQSSIDMSPSAASSATGPKTKNPMPKLNVKEDLDAMFEGQELTEEFQDKLSTLFEAAVHLRTVAETARLEEQFEQELVEQVSAFTEQVVSKIDSYLDVIVEEWMTENQVAVESSLRNELMDEFIDGMKNLFAEHYIDVPQTRIDVVEALAEKVSALEETVDGMISENTDLKRQLSSAQVQEAFDEIAEDLALTQKEKLAALAEGIEYNGDVDVFSKKLAIIKESYFKTEASSTTSLEEETFDGNGGVLNESVGVRDPAVNRYAQALARTVKSTKS